MNLSRSITGAGAVAVSFFASSPVAAEMTLDPGTSVTFHHHDLLGSPVMVSDHKGRVLWYENTKPYGEGLGKKSSSGLGHLDNTVSEATTGLGYTGHTVDSSIGLVYMKARHYDPVIGRFYSNDPVGFTTSNPMMFNRYAYVNSNPIRYGDPSGKVIELDITCGAECYEEETTDSKNTYGEVDFTTGYEDNDHSVLIPGTGAGEFAAQYWADIAVNSDHVLAPLANVPGLFASLWTPETAASTTTILSIAAVPTAARVTGGWTVRAGPYAHGGGGVNILKNGVRKFAVDWHKFKLDGNIVKKLHYHRGSTKNQMKKHRPWQGGW